MSDRPYSVAKNHNLYTIVKTVRFLYVTANKTNAVFTRMGLFDRPVYAK